MNSSQNEIVEKLIGQNTSHEFGSFTKTEIKELTGFYPSDNALKVINGLCKAKSEEDIKEIDEYIKKSWKGGNATNYWLKKFIPAINKLRDIHKDKFPPNIIIPEDVIKTDEDAVKWKKTTEQDPEQTTEQAPSDKSLEEPEQTSKPVDKPQPDETDETDEKGEKNKDIELKRKKNMEQSARKYVTKEEKKKIEEFQAKHNKNLEESVLRDMIEDRRTKDDYYNAESEYGPEIASEMVPEIANVKDIKPLTDEEKNKVKKKLKKYNNDIKILQDHPFDKEAFERKNLDGIQTAVNQIKKEAITGKNEINRMITPYITGVWKDEWNKNIETNEEYKICKIVRAANRKYMKQKIDEILAQIDCHINIDESGGARVNSGAESRAKYRELKGIKPQTVNDKETFFIYDNSHIDSIIEDFIQKRISKKYHMSDEAKSNINALINNETKTLRNTGSDKHGAEEVINSKFINELAKPIEEYINSKINRIAIAKSKKLSDDEKLQHMKKFKLSTVTKMKLEEILLRDTANLHPDSSNL